MLPFSRSFHHATKGVQDPDATVYLTRRCVHDIKMWRALLMASMKDATLLESSTFAPPLRQRAFPGETVLQREARAQAHADVIAFSDASKGSDSPPCIGGVVPGFGWFSCETPNLRLVTTSEGKTREADINIHEFLGLVTTAALAIEALKIKRPQLKGGHVHIRCDNTSSVARARNQRANLPIYSLLLSIFSFIQLQTGVLITVGFIEGKLNLLADAASRRFKVPNGQQLHSELRQLQQFQVGKKFLNSIEQSAMISSPNDLPLVLGLLTKLGGVISCNSLLNANAPPAI